MVPTANRSSSRAGATRRGGTLRVAGHEAVERLAAFDAGPHWVVSCYLKLEPRDRARGKYLIKLKNRIRDRLATLERDIPERSAREAVARDLERVRSHLSHPGSLPAGRGVAIFACGPRRLFQAIALPRVFRSRLVVGRAPMVRELAALDAEFGTVLCALHDRNAARLFRVTAFAVDELPGLAAQDLTRPRRFHGAATAARGGYAVSGEHNFHQRIQVEKHRHHAQIAQHLFELSRSEAVQGVVLAANGEDGTALQAHLHPYVTGLVLGTARLNAKTASAQDVMRAVLDVRHAADQRTEQSHVQAVREGRGTGWAVNGIEETLESLARGQVRLLLVDAAEGVPGWRCGASGRLTSRPDGCRGEGPDVAVADVIDEAIEDALRQQCEVKVVEDGEARNGIRGLAAILRFR